MPILTEEERLGTLVAGKYRLESMLGKGGMGVVYRGTHSWTGRTVAVKLLHPTYASEAEVVRRFLHEARAASSIHHPNVVEVLDMGNDTDGSVYLVLELLRGRPLADLVDDGKRLEPNEMLRYLSPIMRALALAHSRGIVHRDLKPDNIFLATNAEGQLTPKLLDFGIAKLTEGSAGMTRTGAVMGTPYYMSPEQASGKSDVGAQADVWSMGVVVYQCLSGQVPFTGTSPTAVLVAVMTTKAPSLRSVRSDIPAAIASVVERALEPEREKRYATIDEFHAALVAAVTGQPPIELASTAPSHPPAEQRTSIPVQTPFATSAGEGATVPAPPTRARWPLAVGAIALVAVASVAAIQLGIGSSGAPSTTVMPAATTTTSDPPSGALAVTPSELDGCVAAGDDGCIVRLLGGGRAHETAELRTLFGAERTLGLRDDACGTARALVARDELSESARAPYQSFVDADCAAAASAEQATAEAPAPPTSAAPASSGRGHRERTAQTTSSPPTTTLAAGASAGRTSIGVSAAAGATTPQAPSGDHPPAGRSTSSGAPTDPHRPAQVVGWE